MSIRIPSAQEAGFGNRVPEAIPAPVAVPVVPGFVDKSGTGEAIGKGLRNLGGTLGDIGAQQQLHEGRMTLLNEEFLAKQKLIEDQKVFEAQKATEASRAQVNMLGLRDEINRGVKDIADRTDLTPQEKMQAFSEHMNGINQRYKDTIPQDLYNHFNPIYAEHAYKARTQLADAITKQADDARVADGTNALAALENMAAEDPTQRQPVKDQAKAILDTLPIHETAKAEMFRKFESSVDRNEVLSRLNAVGKDGYHIGLDKVLSDLQVKGKDGAFGEYIGLDPTDRDALIKTTQSMMFHEERQKEADKRAVEAEFRARVKDTLESYSEWKLSGLPVNPKEELRIARLVKGTEFEAKYNAIKNQGESAGFIWKKLEEDPLTFGAARLGIQVKPLNFTDPNLMSQGIAERLAIGAKVKQNLGMTFTPVLTTEEVKGLTEFIKKDAQGAGIDFMDKLTRQLGEREVTGMAMQMAKSDPGMATVVRYVASGDTLTARAIANGQKIIESKGLKMPKEEDLGAKFWEDAGGSLRAVPNNAKEVYDAYKAAYANAANTAGIQDGTFNKDIAGWSFRQVVGDVADVNGAKTVLPKGVSEESFLNSVKRISPDTVKQMGGAYGMDDKSAAEKIRSEGQFYMAGDGVYRVLVNGLPLRTADQRRYLQFNPKSLDFEHPITGAK